MTTVHIVFNAHLDPIWLWSWRDGLDEVLNTSYYICNLLDRHPDITYTRGEAWLYEQIQRVDPALFQRIQKHVKEGRWCIVGGWYVQPDCNLPSGFAMDRQIETGRRLFNEYFGAFPEVAYNVDSFGHSAALPGLMRRAGQKYYVMMRPGEHERDLPARLFRWRGHAGGGEVITFRIADANCYCTPTGLTERHVQAALTELPPGITHTMCFAGVGDHGGGPTEEMIQWVRDHRNAFPGVELVFSSPEKFFAAVKEDAAKLPEVVGELQMHAVGCYSVHRPVKVGVRKAEHRLVQAGVALEKCPSVQEDAAMLEAAWKRLCFHHFHDTLCGTCLPSALQDVDAQLGGILTAADDLATYALRKRVVQMEDDPAQRIVLLNASDRPFADYVEIEPFLEWTRWQPGWRLVDAQGKPVPYQTLLPESFADVKQTRLLFPVSAEPGELQTLRIMDAGCPPEPLSDAVSASFFALKGGKNPVLDLAEPAGMDFGLAKKFPLPVLSLYDDPSDTWSHGVERFGRVNKETAVWGTPKVVDRGPLMGSLQQAGRIGNSELQAEWRVYRRQPWIECRMRVVWMEKWRLLKWEWEMPGAIAVREDGIMEGSLVRETDGIERPLRDWSRLTLNAGGQTLDAAVICPDVYSVDCDAHRLSLTLLRGVPLACHNPPPGLTNARKVYCDRGEHFFRFRFLAADRLETSALDNIAIGMQRPPLSAELTRGMRNRNLRDHYAPPKMTP